MLLALPVLAATVLGGLRVQSSLQRGQALAAVTATNRLATAATSLADALQQERDLSASILPGRPAPPAPAVAPAPPAPPVPVDADVQAARDATDRARAAFATVVTAVRPDTLPGGDIALLDVQSGLQELAMTRQEAFAPTTTGRSPVQKTVADYDSVIQSVIGLGQDMALGTGNAHIIRTAHALQQFSLAQDEASVVRAVIGAALAGPGGRLSPDDQAYAAQAAKNRESLLNAFRAAYGSSAAAPLLASLTHDSSTLEADQYARQVLADPTGRTSDGEMSAATWTSLAGRRIQAMNQVEQHLLADMDGQAAGLQSHTQRTAVLNAILVSLVLMVAVGGAVLVARSMARALARLQRAAEDVAEHQLPQLVIALSQAEPQEVNADVSPIGIDSTDEIGHVARAFDMVHREAVRLAAEQALLRGNINAMFTNLSRRSQGLIQRQLSLISELESREADPDQLASLFKLDHLATRMRRNGENLLVLAGEDPGRRWTRPVPLVDVLRAAASEVEQYERIELAAVPSAEVAGRVVNDLVHLLAELLENATSFSSPQTRVRVTGHALPDGRVLVEIHDTGIGLSPEDLAEINERLANPPTVDVAVSRRMGLFVVGRLALRHGIRIQLRPSDSAGTVALVILPADLTPVGAPPVAVQGTAPPLGGYPGRPLGPAEEPLAVQQGGR
ncbi:nitrate- and nitrite sensing domain-containing protein [Kitasatospora sp. MAA4]|uniref:sensor histidine kinase n=1 Tax=Kitasatospora sp. MAA4 TaxID=3035093 RepID=UPI0024735D05|nr:nitrate- and nitrite sensing domain-containing protein [Kitasatospora sp. MAA4]